MLAAGTKLDIPPYRHNPVPGARFLERTLNEGER